MAASIFVTATDTGAGKSFVTAALTRALLAQGHDVAAIKPVSCGRAKNNLNEDVAILLEAQGMRAAQAGEINLYDFSDFSAPAFAAHSGKDGVELQHLAAWCERICNRHALTLIEGIGGLMVPLNAQMLVSDWLAKLPQAEVLLVVRARLGGINHALLTLEVLRKMQRFPRWIVVNAADAAGDAMLAQHCEAIAPRLEGKCRLLTLPYQSTQYDAALNPSASPLEPLLADLAWKL